MTRTKNALLASLAGFTLLAAPLEAVVAPRSAAEKEFRNPGLTIPSLHTPASQFGSKSAAALPDLAGLGVPPEWAFYDPLAQRWASAPSVGAVDPRHRRGQPALLGALAAIDPAPHRRARLSDMGQ